MAMGIIKKTTHRMVAGLLVLFSAATLFAENAAHSEYEVKAAFLYNFAKFVEWPPDAFQKTGGHVVIGIYGSDPFGNTLDDVLEGKTIQDKEIVLKHVSNLDQASDCQILFVGASKESNLDEVLSTTQKLPVLTVSDINQFAQRGGVVGFTVEDNRVRFSINEKVAEKSGLKISSQLLKLAKTVISRLPPITRYVWSPFKIIPFAQS
jgi:hypothetical protein